jgi:hypothetical protein
MEPKTIKSKNNNIFEDDIDYFEKERRPQFLENGRGPKNNNATKNN